jgi:hypothetical protein
MTNRDERPEECEFCQYKTATLALCTDPIRQPPKWLCELCRPTPAGIAAFYPEQYDAKTLQAISYIGNVILTELRRTRTSP